MSEEISDTSDRGYVTLKYVGHVAFLTGTTKEAFPVPEEGTIRSLLGARQKPVRGRVLERLEGDAGEGCRGAPEWGSWPRAGRCAGRVAPV